MLIPAILYVWGDEVVVQEPGCLTDGISYVKCINCNQYETMKTSRLGHDWVTVDKKDASCTEDGHDAGRYCSRCDNTRGMAVIPSTGHVNVETLDAVAPTCTETGLTEGSKCADCGTVIVEQEVIPSTGHKYDKLVTEATCTEDGYTTYTCECGYSYKGDITSKLNHDYKIMIITEPTCTKAGNVTYTCCRCGDSYEVEYGKPTGHNMDEEWQIVEDATCTEEGLQIKGCSKCKYIEEDVIPATGHVNVKTLDAVAPTCTKTGLTEGVQCACGEVLKAQESVPALGHIEVTVSGKDATCEETGLTEGMVCGREDCGKVLIKQEVIPALGHDWEVVSDECKAATCTEDGLKVEKCIVCEESKSTIVKAPGHELKYHDGKAATCTENGYEAYEECTVCDYSTYKEIEATGHKFTEEVIDATCTTAGKIIRICKCGYEETEAGDPIKGHEYGAWEVTKEATCTENGERTRVCGVCGDVETEVIEASGHTYGDEIYQKPTETEDGGTYVECDCGHIKWLEKQTWKQYVEAAVKATEIDTTATASTETETTTISWTVTGEFDPDGYTVYRSTAEDGEFVVIAETTEDSFVDETAEVGCTYYYKVIGHLDVMGDKVETQWSNVVSAMIEKVTEDYVEESQMYSTTKYAVKGIKVMWTNPRVKVDGYQIYRSTSLNGKYKKIKETSTNARTWTNYNGLKIGKKYYYKVRGYKYVDGKKTYTKFSKRGYRYVLNTKNSKLAMTIEGVDGIIAKDAYKVSSGIKVKWTKYKAVKCTKYKVYRATSENGTYKLIARTKNKYYTDKSKSLKKGTTYYYKIVGYRVFGKAYPQTNKSKAVSATR